MEDPAAVDPARPAPEAADRAAGGQRSPCDVRLTYVVGRHPLLTTTFIDREIELLRRWGVRVQVVSLRRPTGPLSPAQEALRDGVHYVLPVPIVELVTSHLRCLLAHPLRFLATLLYLLSRPHPSWRARLWTLLHFGEGIHVATLLRTRYPTDHLHAHFVDRAATVALVAGRILGIPFSATAHANDIYVDPVLLPEKISQASFVVTCTHYNAAHLAAVAPESSRVVCVHHGLDVRRYPSSRATGGPVPLLLAVGQLREKKGFPHLLEACRTLRDRGYEFRCEIVGEGPLRATLEDLIVELGLDEVVALVGALPHDAVIERYHEAAIFVLPCVIAPDGGRDGIPNVILEAMAVGLPVVSTRHSGIPEAVEDGTTGLLVPPADPLALADALADLLDDTAGREDLGRRGRELVVDRFDLEKNVRRLLDEFAAAGSPR